MDASLLIEALREVLSWVGEVFTWVPVAVLILVIFYMYFEHLQMKRWQKRDLPGRVVGEHDREYVEATRKALMIVTIIASIAAALFLLYIYASRVFAMDLVAVAHAAEGSPSPEQRIKSIVMLVKSIVMLVLIGLLAVGYVWALVKVTSKGIDSETRALCTDMIKMISGFMVGGLTGVVS